MAAYVTARNVRGVPITVQRLAGQAPNVTTTSANVQAVIPANKIISEDPTGETVSLDSRVFIVLAADLAATNFPMPVKKDDRILIPGSGYKLSVINVDADKRAIGGAIEITTTGVS